MIAVVVCLAPVCLAQTVVDPNLRVQTWVSGLSNPTGAAIFNTRGDMMVIEKNTGRVRLVRDRRIRGTLLDLPVANSSERGLLGLVLSPTFATDNLVYLYHTAATADGGTAISNKISRYRYDGSSLVFDRKIIDLPVLPGENHNGGKLVFGPDGKLYAVNGDVNLNNQTANYGGTAIQNTAAVLRLNPSGTIPADNPFSGDARAIYAYGIRNSFGIAFDPVTGDLWDTENGPGDYDEINRVFKGFNSGWERIMGPSSRQGGVPALNPLGPAAVYDDPKFSWVAPVAPTDLEFFPSSRLGAEYKNDLFVGTTRGGKVLRFELTGSRRSLRLEGPLADLVADNSNSNRFAEQDALLFGNDFGLVSDLLVGPGGLYVVDFAGGTIYRITTQPTAMRGSVRVPEPGWMAAAVSAAVMLVCRRRPAGVARARFRSKQGPRGAAAGLS